MMIRWTWVAVVATLFALATPLAYADDDDGGGGNVASLDGESFISQETGPDTETSDVDGTCELTGPSTFTFTITGTATGNYPGTFVETGTFVLNPISVAADSFESTFTINSLAGTVTGSKSLEGFEATSFPSFCTPILPPGGPDAATFRGTVSYEATITTPNGTGADSGEAFVSLQDFQVRGVPNSNGFSFSETFTSDAPGGGGDDDDDDDDDDEEDDDDGDDD
jgi:hypothetical protein